MYQRNNVRVLAGAIAITTSSKHVLPARSPIPLHVNSTWRTPWVMASRVFADANPKSSWQCALKITFSLPGQFSFKYVTSAPNSCGKIYPTVSGTFIVVAPASITAVITSTKNLGSVRHASSAENSTSPVFVSRRSSAYLTAL